MRKVAAGLFMSLDGVVEEPSEWLLPSDEMWQLIGAGIEECDAILLGRRTYLDFAQRWPPQGNDNPMATFLNNSPKYVVSQTLDTLAWDHSTLIAGDLGGAVAELKAQPGKTIRVPGSPRLVRSLLRQGLLDELSLMIHPTIAGSGGRLFDGMSERVNLELVDSRTFGTGVLAVTYRASGT